jgi:hypothetical protein
MRYLLALALFVVGCGDVCVEQNGVTLYGDPPAWGVSSRTPDYEPIVSWHCDADHHGRILLPQDGQPHNLADLGLDLVGDDCVVGVQHSHVWTSALGCPAF